MSGKRTINAMILGGCLMGSAAVAADPACRAVSGAGTLPLVELYTSEGCSSCPPADRWISKSFAPGTDGRAGVLAFHVDYWDRLGWPDRFARAEWSKRQDSIARASASPTVYTPQVLLQGRDFDWRDAGALRSIARASAKAPRAEISVEARRIDRAVFVVAKARIPSPADRGGARLLVAFTDSGHITDVKRGENEGVVLRHEHVVRALATSGAPDRAGMLALDATFALPADAGGHPRVVVFVERDARREILQSMTLDLEGCGTP
ncbi:MAG: DUF1223 domain-containing protein [Burkholderiales bacterium]|jgi:hypothetical protein|nr:DUF1223 domain-containing protein [Burkholderiales bacterium]